MSGGRAIAVLVLLVATAGSASAQSLWRDDARGTNLFTDHRAHAVGDVLTILISEQSTSSRSAQTTTEKDTSRTASINNLPGLDLTGRNASVAPYLKYDIAGKGSHSGKGSIDRSDRVTGQIAARVVKVFDNGNLLIEGRRAVLVNDETQILTLSGTVRPEDISGANAVLSSQIADAEIQMIGRGLLADTQRPGIFYRILDWLRLF